jgi:hypothetical protein
VAVLEFRPWVGSVGQSAVASLTVVVTRARVDHLEGDVVAVLRV